MIRAFVFDIGNVLLRFDFSLAHRKILSLCTTPPSPECLERVDAIKVDYEAGLMDRATFLKVVFDLIQFRGTEAEFVKAWEEIFELNLPMTGLVDSLHGRYPLYLLSNTSDIHVDYFTKEYPLFSRFDDAVYSYKVRCAKPDRSIYELAATQFGVKPEETVFIDDLAVNIASAREVGFQAIQYDFRRHDLLLEELARLGVE
jgi:HAD superfamily hydrolase (TIGR01509 family)